uniref:Uncharacterized protein n=1 Tax=Triticum urartu TaxID=4572 RepID=A0A8R7TD38_TRIUA
MMTMILEEMEKKEEHMVSTLGVLTPGSTTVCRAIVRVHANMWDPETL